MKPDILWFLLDSVRPDRLASCGGGSGRRTFLDDVLEQGTLFSRAITAGPYTSLAVNSVFTSLYGTTHGVDAPYKTTTDDLDPDVVTITDILKQAGYSTLCFSGSPFEPMEPVPGFDLYRLMPRLDESVFEAFEAAPPPRFLCLSFQQVHDACCNRPQEMTAENYDATVRELAEQFELFYRRLVGPGDVALVYSDHGMRLRDRVEPGWEPRPELEPTTGVYLTEGTIRTFAGLIRPGLFPARVIGRPVRSIDLAPTLLEALSLPVLAGQGLSLWPWLRDGREIPELVAYTETGGRWFSPWRPNIRGVRTERFKFTRHDDLGEAFHDLEADPGEERNLVGRGHPEEARLRAELDARIRDAGTPARAHYEARGFDYRAILARREPLPAVPELAKAMNAYEGACHALADDAVAPVRDHAEALARLARREAEKLPDTAETRDERSAFLLLSGVADELARAAELETARKAFGRISELFIAYIRQRPLFAESIAAYDCPGVPGTGRWVQKRNDDRLVNPYLGRSPDAAIREIGLAP